MSDTRDSSDWRDTLKRNWPYMLTGGLISVFLWVAVSADTVGQQTIPTDLEIFVADRQYVMTDRDPPVDVVSVVFAGRQGDLAALSIARPQIIVMIDSVESLSREVRLTPEMVRSRGGRELGDVRPVGIQPSRIRLHFQRLARKVVPVVPSYRITLAEGFVLSDSVRTEPSVVAVEGAVNSVERIDSVSTLPFERLNLRDSVSMEVLLERPEPSDVMELSSEAVRLVIPVETRAETVFPGVPLTVRGPALDGLRIEPAVVDIRLTGPRSRIDRLRPEGLTPFVEVSGSRDLGKLLPVRSSVDSPFVEVTIEPDSVRVLVAQDRAGQSG